MLRYILLMVGAIVGTCAFAQLPHGFYIGMAIGVGLKEVKTQENVDYFGDGTNYTDRNTTESGTKASPKATVSFGYEYAAPNHYLIGASLFAQFASSGTSDIESYTYDFNGTTATHHSDGVSTDIKGLSYGFLISPGYQFSEKDAVFINLGMKFMQASTTYGKTWYTLNGGAAQDEIAASTKDESLSGFVYGLGYDHKISQRLSLFTEVNVIEFSQYTYTRSEADEDLVDRNETYTINVNNVDVEAGVRYQL